MSYKFDYHQRQTLENNTVTMSAATGRLFFESNPDLEIDVVTDLETAQHISVTDALYGNPKPEILTFNHN